MTKSEATVRRLKRRVRNELRLIVVLLLLICTTILLMKAEDALEHKAQTSEQKVTESIPIAEPISTEAPAINTVTDIATPGPTEPSPYSWLEWKEGQFVQVEYGTETSNDIDTSSFIDPSTKNNHDLVEWAKMAWRNQWGYVWGTFGYVLTENLLADRIAQYPDDLNEYVDIIRQKWMDRRVVDCAGLIKSYGWYDPLTNSIEYSTNGMVDTGTDGMWNAASVKGDISTLPDEPGILVYSTKGHIGVYIGGGYAIEAISHEGGVVKTKVADRPWTGWLECPYISYIY